MPRRDLVSLTIAAIDETERIRNLQKLVTVCLDEMANPDNDTVEKLFLIIDSYRASMDNHIQELEVALGHLRRLVLGEENSSN